MTEVWEPVAGEEVYINLYGEKFKTLFIGVQSNGFGVFEVTDEMGKYYEDDVYCSSIPMEKFSPIPKTKLIHGVEVPDISFVPEYKEMYCSPAPDTSLKIIADRGSNSEVFSHRVRHNLCYPCTEEGEQAAILHAKAMLGIADE